MSIEDGRAHPVAFEFQMTLLLDHVGNAERLGWRWQQIEFEFGDWQEQRLWRFDLGVGHRAGTLLDDLAQGLGACDRFAGLDVHFHTAWVDRNRRAVGNLISHRACKSIRPQLRDTTKGAAVADAKVA